MWLKSYFLWDKCPFCSIKICIDVKLTAVAALPALLSASSFVQLRERRAQRVRRGAQVSWEFLQRASATRRYSFSAHVVMWRRRQRCRCSIARERGRAHRISVLKVKKCVWFWPTRCRCSAEGKWKWERRGALPPSYALHASFVQIICGQQRCNNSIASGLHRHC